MTDAKIWRGELRKGREPGTVEGWLEDPWHWRVAITGTRQADGSYILEGVLSEPPPALRIEAVDGEAAA